MRLLKLTDDGQISLTRDLYADERPPYAILSHTWAEDNSKEVTFAEVGTVEGQKKAGYEKIRFCAEQAKKDGINHFWVDTCCIDKTNLVELSEAITSMFRWYQEAVKCYVYLSDVSYRKRAHEDDGGSTWKSRFRSSKWFTRGWTLQELLSPKVVEFFSYERALLGDKKTLAQQIHAITSIPVEALRDTPLPRFSVAERMRWAEKRQTKKPEDRAYCLLGIFDISIPVIYGEGEKKAFRRLQREIQEQSGTAAQSAHVHWMVPRTANPLFTGRQDLLQELEDTIRDAVYCPWDREQCRIVISGLGGQGKSEICLQLARRLRQIFWAVLWIDVSTPEIARSSLLEAARRLSMSAHDWQDALYGIANLQRPWILILDNADDLEVDYRDYFPDSRYGVVLMTTRNDEFQQYSTDQSVALEGLETSEGLELLLKAARIPPNYYSRYNEDARQVVELLQSHALALVQAGAYVARGHCTLSEYPRLYERQRQCLLTFRPKQARSRYRDVYATFEVSAQVMSVMGTQASQDALQLLPLVAVCQPSQFPLFLFEAGWQGAQRVSLDLDDDAKDDEVELLTPWHVTRLPELCGAYSNTWDVHRLVEAVSLLKAFSLASTDARNGLTHISLHPLVHAWARDRQDQQQQQQAWLGMGCMIAFALKSANLTQDQRRQLQPHAEALVTWPIDAVFLTGPSILLARILVHIGWYLLNQRADAKLSIVLHDMFAILKLDRLEVEQQWIGLYSLIARNVFDQGRTQEAVILFRDIVKLRSRTLARDHPHRLTSQRTLAAAYESNGQTRKAIALLEEVVEIGRQTLARDHPQRLASQHELAIAYESNGQTRKAIALLEEVVEIERQTLARDHPQRLSSQHSLATYLWDMGERERSVGIMTHVVDVRRRVLAEDHPHRKGSEQWLAYFKRNMADLEPN